MNPGNLGVTFNLAVSFYYSVEFFLSFLLIKEKSHAAMDMGSVSPRNYTASSIYLLSGPIIKVRPFKKQSFQAFSLLNIS